VREEWVERIARAKVAKGQNPDLFIIACRRGLWLGHALPVLVVLVDLESGEMYWQRVSAATVIKTGKSYKIEVPRRQALATAGAEWPEIASGLEQHAVSRFEYSLLSVPPRVRTLLEGRGEGERADAALLAMSPRTCRPSSCFPALAA